MSSSSSIQTADGDAQITGGAVQSADGAQPASHAAQAEGAPRAPWEPNPKAAPWRQAIGRFVLSGSVQGFVLTVIVINAVFLGLETDPGIVSRFGTLLHILDVIALTIFVLELLLKLIALGPRFFRDGWNVFDFLVIVIALIPASGPFAVLRSLRVLRVFRLVSRAPQLRRIAGAVVKAIPGIGAIAGLMSIVFYVSAVMATSLFGEKFPDWFGSVPASLYSLFQVMTLESWSMGIVRPVMEAYPEAWMFFVPFILVSAFVMLNLFVAVIVDTMANMNETEAGTVAAPKPVAAADPHPEHATAIFSAHKELAQLNAEIAQLKELVLKLQK